VEHATDICKERMGISTRSRWSVMMIVIWIITRVNSVDFLTYGI